MYLSMSEIVKNLKEAESPNQSTFLVSMKHRNRYTIYGMKIGETSQKSQSAFIFIWETPYATVLLNNTLDTL